jgi:hypothetical protein
MDDMKTMKKNGQLKLLLLAISIGMLFAGCTFKAEVGTSLFGNSSQSAGYSTGLSSCGGE